MISEGQTKFGGALCLAAILLLSVYYLAFHSENFQFNAIHSSAAALFHQNTGNKANCSTENLKGTDNGKSTKDYQISSPCSKWQNFFRQYRFCLWDSMRATDDIWKNLSKHVTRCSAKAFDPLKFQYLTNKDDVKVTILPPPEESTVAVTLGIGGDIGSELKLLAAHPKTKFFGADPQKDKGALYKKIGKYFEIAVGGKTGLVNSSVLVGPGIFDYAFRLTGSVSLDQFLTNWTKTRTVDFLWMDSEGAEYSTLQQFVRGAQLERAGVTVCQLNVELHGPLAKYHMTPTLYNDLLRLLVSDSPFLPFYAYPPINHCRAFFFNVSSEFCLRKYGMCES